MLNRNTLLKRPDEITVLIQGICSVLWVGLFQFLDRQFFNTDLQILVTICPLISAGLIYFIIQKYHYLYLQKDANKKVKVIKVRYQIRFDLLNQNEAHFHKQAASCDDNLKSFFEDKIKEINEKRMSLTEEMEFEIRNLFRKSK